MTDYSGLGSFMSTGAGLLSGGNPLVSGGISLLGSAMSNAAAEQRQNQAENFNAQQTGLQDIFNHQEAAASRDFTAEQASLARDYNWNAMKDTQSFDAAQGDLNRQFQQTMSSTAYQRATADMKAAGINPMLAYMQGGASTPSGATASAGAASSPSPSGAQASGGSASAPSPPPVVNLLQNMLNSALDASRTKAQVDNVTAQTKTEGERANQVNASAWQNTQAARVNAATVSNIEQDTANKEKTGEILDSAVARSKIDASYFGSKLGWWTHAAGDFGGDAGAAISPVLEATRIGSMINSARALNRPMSTETSGWSAPNSAGGTDYGSYVQRNWMP